MAEIQGDEAQEDARPEEEEDGSRQGLALSGDTVADTVSVIARAIVDHPDDVRVEATEGDRGPRYHLSVHPEDVGRVIGRGGRIASAIRLVARAAATREGIHILLEIGD